MYHAIRSVFFNSKNVANKFLRHQAVTIRTANALAANIKKDNIRDNKKTVTKEHKEEEENNDDVLFGVGGKLVEMDSKSKQEKNNSFANQFGTLANKVDDISFRTSITTIKPLSTREEAELDKKEVEFKKTKEIDYMSRTKKTGPYPENYYVTRMREFEAKKEIKSAIDVFYIDMIQRDRYRPTLRIYSVLIKICHDASYYQDAIMLYDHLIKYDIANYGSASMHKIFSIIIHVCAFMKPKDEALKKLDEIRAFIKERNIVLNLYTYNSMIQAYSRHGKIEECLAIVEEMKKNKIKINQDVHINLLSSSLSKKTGGFRMALELWHKMLKQKVNPNAMIYALLLKIIKECTFCDDKSQLKQLPPDNKEKNGSHENQFEKTAISIEKLPKIEEILSEIRSEEKKDKQIPVNSDSEVIKIEPSQVHVIDEMEVVGKALASQLNKLEWWQSADQNINKVELLRPLQELKGELKENDKRVKKKDLADRVLLDHKFDLDNLELYSDTPSERLKVIGHIQGFCKAMKLHMIAPDIKIFTQLLFISENSIENEVDIMNYMKTFKVEYDVDFFNLLIKKRAFRRDFKAMDEALALMQANKFSPNIRTFGALSHKVTNSTHLENFLNDMKKFNFGMNCVIVAIIASNAFFHYNFKLLNTILDTVKDEKVQLTNRFMKDLEVHVDKVRGFLIDMERRHPNISPNTVDEMTFDRYTKMRRFYQSLIPYYKKWKKETWNLVQDDKDEE